MRTVRQYQDVEIREWDRSRFPDQRFQFICDKIYLVVDTTPEGAIEQFRSLWCQSLNVVVQLSRYPTAY